MAVINATTENYEEIINGKSPVLIDCFAELCGPCKMLSPIFEKLSDEYSDRLIFAKLDTMAEPDIASKNNVSSIPCLIVFNNGKEVDRIIGYMNISRLKSAIESILHTDLI